MGSLVASFLTGLGSGVREAFFMFWETLWALVLGFGLSGAVQAFVSRGEMERVLGRPGLRSITRATVLGAASSSCSYAATAMAKSLFQKGADFVASMTFMFASTNLVIELGIVIALLLGWQFTASEVFGGLVMIVLFAILARLALPARLVVAAQRRLRETGAAPPDEEGGGGHRHGQHDGGVHGHAERDGGDHGEGEHSHGEHGDGDVPAASEPLRKRLRSLAAWSDAASYAMADITMLRREMLIGFGVAGFLAVLVPEPLWQSVFFSGHGSWTSLENAIIGPFIAIISFVCSIGNVPLAAALWKGGISFGGVVSFIFADLITLPLLLIYRKFYGWRLTLWILASFWTVMAAAGLLTEYAFSALHAVPSTRPTEIAPTSLSWNYTTALDIIALGALGVLYYLYRNRERFGGGAAYAIDPVCGMQVERSSAPARVDGTGGTYFFCSDRCCDRFRAAPARYAPDVSAQDMGAVEEPSEAISSGGRG